MGLKTIALHTPSDRGARFTRLADEVLETPSYLDGPAIVAAAKAAGAEALHPGYGFLSENADFAEYCEIEDVVFVGPPPAAMRAMGLKSSAKSLMARTGAPVLPGYHGDNQTPKFLKERAYQIGYPVLIKAIAGGGGRGIRRVDAHMEFEAALESAQREAEAAFGDPRVLIEKLILAPRHIEVQVFGDTHGNVVHLYERDCSMQRRRQKLIEETPAPGLPAPTRAAMTEAAVAIAKSVGYVGAGTVEFIVDASRGLGRDSFFFLEMNTRLQVEHPVTEAVLGVDLVEWQLRVAAGEPLPKSQSELTPRGVAIEARINAEDPETGFLPSPGRLRALRLDGLGVRVDSGFDEGDEISPNYDSLVAKLIAHADARDEAIAKLDAALAQAVVMGPKTNIAFLRGLLAAPEFVAARHDTGFIDANLERLGATPQPPDAAAALAGLRAILPEVAPTPGAGKRRRSLVDRRFLRADGAAARAVRGFGRRPRRAFRRHRARRRRRIGVPRRPRRGGLRRADRARRRGRRSGDERRPPDPRSAARRSRGRRRRRRRARRRRPRADARPPRRADGRRRRHRRGGAAARDAGGDENGARPHGAPRGPRLARRSERRRHGGAGRDCGDGGGMTAQAWLVKQRAHVPVG